MNSIKIFSIDENNTMSLTDEFRNLIRSAQNEEIVVVTLGGLVQTGRSSFGSILAHICSPDIEKFSDGFIFQPFHEEGSTMDAETINSFLNYKEENKCRILLVDIEGLDDHIIKNIVDNEKERELKILKFALIISSVYIYFSKNELVNDDWPFLTLIQNEEMQLTHMQISTPPKKYYMLSRARNFELKKLDLDVNNDGDNDGFIEITAEHQEDFKKELASKNFELEFMNNIEGIVYPNYQSIIDRQENEPITPKIIVDTDFFFQERLEIYLQNFSEFKKKSFGTDHPMSAADFLKLCEKAINALNNNNFQILANTVENQISDVKIEITNELKNNLCIAQFQHLSEAISDQTDIFKVWKDDIKPKLKAIWKTEKIKLVEMIKTKTSEDIIIIKDILKDCKSIFGSYEKNVFSEITRIYEEKIKVHFANENNTLEKEFDDEKKALDKIREECSVILKENQFHKNQIDKLKKEYTTIEKIIEDQNHKIKLVDDDINIINDMEDLLSLTTSLENYRKKTNEKNSIVAELDKEINTYKNSIKFKNDELKHLQETYKNSTENRDSDNVKYATLNDNLKKIITENNLLTQKIRIHDERIHNMNMEVNSLNYRMREANQNLNSLNEKITDIKNENEFLNADNNQMELDLIENNTFQNRDDLDRIYNELSVLERDTNGMRMKVEDLTNKRDRLNDEFTSYKIKFSEEKRMEITAKYLALKVEYEILTLGDFRKIELELEEIKNEINQLDSEKESLERELDEKKKLAEELPEMKNQNKNLTYVYEELSKHKKKRDNLLIEIDSLKNEINELNEGIESLKQQVIDLENTNIKFKHDKDQIEIKRSNQEKLLRINKEEVERKMEELQLEEVELQSNIEILCDEYKNQIEKENNLKRCLLDFKILFETLNNHLVQNQDFDTYERFYNQIGTEIFAMPQKELNKDDNEQVKGFNLEKEKEDFRSSYQILNLIKYASSSNNNSLNDKPKNFKQNDPNLSPIKLSYDFSK